MESTKLDDKIILDATAGFRMMWFNKKHPNCIYLDNRPECEPDIVGDFRDLKQFPNERFRLIVFDPPYFVKKDLALMTPMLRRYGMLQAETWQNDLKLAFKEFWRILQPYGILILKWCNFQIGANEVIKLAPQPPLFYQISANRYRQGKRKGQTAGSDTVQTLWFCFMKIPKEVGV